MEGERRGTSLGDRLQVVALVCGLATALVLATFVAIALFADVGGGAAPSPVRQRLIAAARPADLELAAVALFGGAAVALGRWLDGDGDASSGTAEALVSGGAAAIVVLAAVGMFAEVLWRFEGASWTWYAISVGEHTATAGIAGVACWLAVPPRWWPDRVRG